MHLAIIICTHNRSYLLSKVLESIKEAEINENLTLTLFIVANACSDNTLAIGKKFSNIIEFPVYILEELKPGKCYALNLAINHINDNNWICFIDDDHRLPVSFFNKIVDAILKYPKATILCGRVLPDWQGNEPRWVHQQGQYKIYPLPIPHFELGKKPLQLDCSSKLPGGGNLLIKKEVFNRVGLFLTELGPIGNSLRGSEDSEFLLRALAANEKLQYDPSIIQYHFVDPNRLKISYLLKKSYERTRSLMLVKNPKKNKVPLYLWRKLLTYFTYAVFSFNNDKRRFYLVRTAAALGEIHGLMHSLRK